MKEENAKERTRIWNCLIPHLSFIKIYINQYLSQWTSSFGYYTSTTRDRHGSIIKFSPYHIPYMVKVQSKTKTISHLPLWL